MTEVLDLRKCSPEVLQDFLNSFDIVLSDCDGVLWYLENPIEGAVESLKTFQNLGKKIYLVTNNSMISANRYSEKLKKFGFEFSPDHIINASKVVAWYLKKCNFHGEAFVIASPSFRQVLSESGIKLSDEGPQFVESDAMATLNAMESKPSVKAVIADFCVSCDWLKLGQAISCLKRDDVWYLCGAHDEWVVYGNEKKILGPGPLIDVISKQSGRSPIECGKPSEALKSYIFDVCKIQDPRRCLFIGDTVNHDMKFGTLCGFLKLFVGTGLDRLEDAQKRNDTCPDFYIESLGLLFPMFDKLLITPKNDIIS